MIITVLAGIVGLMIIVLIGIITMKRRRNQASKSKNKIIIVDNREDVQRAEGKRTRVRSQSAQMNACLDNI